MKELHKRDFFDLLNRVFLAKLNSLSERILGRNFWNMVWYVMFAILMAGFCSNYIKTDTMLRRERGWAWLILMAILLVKLYCFSGYRVWELGIISTILLIMGISAIFSGYILLFRLCVVLFSARGICYDRISRLAFRGFAILLAVVLILTACGITEDVVIRRTEMVGNGRIRHSFGFDTANGLGLFCMMVTFGCLLTFYDRLNLIICGILVVFQGVFFYFSDSKTAFLCSMLGIVLIYLLRMKGTDRIPGEKIAVRLCYFILGTICIWEIMSVKFNYADRLLRIVNSVVSDRLNLSLYAIQKYGVTLLGQRVDFDMPIDSIFASVPVRYGLLPALIFLGLYLASMVRCIRYRRYEAAAVGLMLFFYSFLESTMVEGAVNLVIYALTADMAGQGAHNKEALFIEEFRFLGKYRNSRI